MHAGQELQKLIFAIIAWTLAMSAFVIFRYSLSPQTPIWVATQADMGTLAVYLGTVLGCLHWLSNLIAGVGIIRRRNYLMVVTFKTAFLALGALALIKISMLLQTWGGDSQVQQEYGLLTHNIVNSPLTQILIVYLILVRVCLAFIEQMALLVGSRNLINMGMGRYHKPHREHRVFLFIDMVSSTAHAEALGDYKFSRLVQDCFGLLSGSVQRYGGEIYRYLGDAVIISWKIRQNRDFTHALGLYFDFMQTLSWNGQYFQDNYGFQPRFKGALHGGKVMAAVVGVDKQELSYFSDVLNTLARLQDQCGPLGQDLLMSGKVRAVVTDGDEFNIQSLGPMRLKGKMQEIEVYAITQNETEEVSESSLQET